MSKLSTLERGIILRKQNKMLLLHYTECSIYSECRRHRAECLLSFKFNTWHGNCLIYIIRTANNYSDYAIKMLWSISYSPDLPTISIRFRRDYIHTYNPQNHVVSKRVPNAKCVSLHPLAVESSRSVHTVLADARSGRISNSRFSVPIVKTGCADHFSIPY